MQIIVTLSCHSSCSGDCPMTIPLTTIVTVAQACSTVTSSRPHEERRPRSSKTSEIFFKALSVLPSNHEPAIVQPNAEGISLQPFAMISQQPGAYLIRDVSEHFPLHNSQISSSHLLRRSRVEIYPTSPQLGADERGTVSHK
jgi:hypothetical protein